MNRFRVTCVIMLMLLAACGSESDTSDLPVFFSELICENPSFTGSGIGFDLEDSVTGVVNSQNDFNTLWLGIGGIAEQSPEIDFTQGAVVIVYGGSRGTNNEWLEIDKIMRSKSGDVIVGYKNYSAEFEGCGGSSVVSFPICIVQTNEAFSEATFEFETLNSCEESDRRI